MTHYRRFNNIPMNHILVDWHASATQNQQDQKGLEMTQSDAGGVFLNQGDLIAVSAIVIGFGVTAIMFRVQREIHMGEEQNEVKWIAWSDWLIFGSVLLALFLAVIPLLAFSYRSFAAAACTAAIILQAGYIPAILAHYRIDIGRGRDIKDLPRERGEPAEKWIVCVSGIVALVFFILASQHSR
ncbi:MAG TPA: hypothetical protein VKV30_14000 [Candidatus Angelobacter sp.]|nr:hypothetical protein [Candidatus Angelobacter sp.]